MLRLFTTIAALSLLCLCAGTTGTQAQTEGGRTELPPDWAIRALQGILGTQGCATDPQAGQPNPRLLSPEELIAYIRACNAHARGQSGRGKSLPDDKLRQIRDLLARHRR